MRNKFATWLQQERESRGLSQAELARIANLHRAIISKIENSQTTPSPETLRAIARALKLPPEEVFRRAGLLPPRPETSPLIEALLSLVAELPPEEQEEILEYARFRFRRIESARRHPPGK